MSAQPTEGCIRRATSTWSRCRCEACRRDQRRLSKLRDAGALPDSPSEAAWAELDRMVAWGWSAGAIASATGIPVAGVSALLEPRARGRRIGRVRARQILGHGQPTQGLVSALGTRRRLQALAVMGWDTATLAARTGVSESWLRHARTGAVAQVQAPVAAAVAGVFEELAMRGGPSKRTVTIATRRHGWAPPLAWDDPDDPDEVPRGVLRGSARSSSRRPGGEVDQAAVVQAMRGRASTPTLTPAERRVVVGRLVGIGCSVAQVAEHLGVAARTVERDRDALGLHGPAGGGS